MKEQIKTEWERVTKGRLLWIAILTGSIIAIAQIIFEVYPRARNPLAFYNGHLGIPFTAFKYWMGMNFSSSFKETYLLIIPVLAMLPHGLSYHADIKSGYIKNIFTRGNKKDYLIAKYIVTFVSGGIAVVIPYLLNLIIALCMLPALTPVRNGQFMSAVGMMQNLLYSKPLIYIFIYILMTFIYAGVFACAALAFTAIVENGFLLSLVPFLLWYGLGIISSFMGTKSKLGSMNPMYLLDMAQVHVVQWQNVIGMILVIGVITAAMYFRNGVKADAL